MNALKLCGLMRGQLSRQELCETLRGITSEEWDELVPYLAESMLITDFWTRLESLDVTDCVPEDVVRFASGCHELAIEREACADAELLAIDSALESFGLELMLLKGTALIAGEYYKQSGVRLFTDFDLLAKPHELEQVVECLNSIGYRFDVNLPKKIDQWFAGGFSSHLPSMQKNDCMFRLEIHAEPTSRTPFCLAGITAREMWSDTSVSPKFKNLVLPSAAAMAFHSFYHAQVNDYPHLKKTEIPRAYLDIETLCDSHKEVDVEKLYSYIKKSRSEGYFRAFLDRVKEVSGQKTISFNMEPFAKKRIWQEYLVKLGQRQSDAVALPLFFVVSWRYTCQLLKNRNQRREFALLNPNISPGDFIPPSFNFSSLESWKNAIKKFC